MNVDETNLNKFLSVDWDRVQQDLAKIDREIELLEKIVAAIESIGAVAGALYEEQHTKPDAHLGAFLTDIEKEKINQS